MKISIITVCKNSENTIKDTLESVRSQKAVDVEHIIFDGGSFDGTLDILDSYKERIKLIRGNDSGIFDAMNQALKFTSGEIIGILNSDDFYSDFTVLDKVRQEFITKETDSVYGNLDIVYENDTNRIYRTWVSGEFERRKFKYGWSIPHPSFFVKKKIYSQLGHFNDNFKISGDYELILRFLYKNRISTSYIQEPLVKMRRGGNSDGNLMKRYRSLKEDHKAWKINNLKPSIYTVPLKPIRKLGQFFIH